MNSELNAEQIESYREQGFLLIPDFLDADELERWRTRIEVAVAGRGDRVLPRADDPKVGASRSVLYQRINLWMDHPGVKELVFDERIGRMAAQLEGVKGIRVWHDQALYKDPWANPTSWHQDNTKWSFSAEHAITIWVALDDVDAHNGCMFFLPGTHRHRLDTDFPTGAPMGAIFEAYPELGDLDPVTVELPGGGCSFHNGLTVHGAAANMTRHPRRAMTCAFMPAGSTFNGIPNVLPKHMLEQLGVGDLLDDDEQNPLVFAEAA
ncbi:MAG: phytanoyl-CoA dioxygenase family protein [Candidatus Latescibacterota bacterium]|nr:phytanoyl-CoA dioxygenase family protein [Candidatus Latescibacterota bacterium]